MGTHNLVISFFDFLNIRSPKIWHSKILFRVVWRAATLARQVLAKKFAVNFWKSKLCTTLVVSIFPPCPKTCLPPPL